MGDPWSHSIWDQRVLFRPLLSLGRVSRRDGSNWSGFSFFWLFFVFPRTYLRRGRYGCWMLLINRTRRGVSQKERSPKVTTTKIRIVIKSFDHPFKVKENLFLGLPPYTRKIGLPESRVLYTVLRSPHIDKKSREQFEMKIKKQFLVIKTETHELRKKFFRLKRRATRRT